MDGRGAGNSPPLPTNRRRIIAYTPKQWVCGETITVDALNHIENGIEECADHPILVVTVARGSQPSPSFSEIKDAYEAGKLIVLKTTADIYDMGTPTDVYRFADAVTDSNSGSVMQFNSQSVVSVSTESGKIVYIKCISMTVSSYGCAVDFYDKEFDE